MEQAPTTPAPTRRTACEESTFGCQCDRSALPEVDVRALPFEDRCPVVTEALGELSVGSTLVIFAQRNPLPVMRDGLGDRLDDFDVEFMQQCAAGCRLAMKRRVPDPELLGV